MGNSLKRNLVPVLQIKSLKVLQSLNKRWCTARLFSLSSSLCWASALPLLQTSLWLTVARRKLKPGCWSWHSVQELAKYHIHICIWAAFHIKPHTALPGDEITFVFRLKWIWRAAGGRNLNAPWGHTRWFPLSCFLLSPEMYNKESGEVYHHFGY